MHVANITGILEQNIQSFLFLILIIVNIYEVLKFSSSLTQWDQSYWNLFLEILIMMSWKENPWWVKPFIFVHS